MGNTGYITKALTGMSYSRETCIGSDMTGPLYEPKDDVMEPINPLGNTSPLPCLQGSQRPYQVSEGPSWQMPKPQEMRGSWRERVIQRYAYCRQSLMASIWLGFLASGGYQKFSLESPYTKADLKEFIWLLLLLHLCKSSSFLKVYLIYEQII